MKAKFIKDETTGNVQILSTTVNITDTDRRLVLGKPISGKLTVNEEDFTVSVDIPKTPEPSDVTKLYEGQLSGFRTTLNNKNQKYSFVFNATIDKIRALGKKTILKEVRDGIDKMFEEVKG